MELPESLRSALSGRGIDPDEQLAAFAADAEVGGGIDLDDFIADLLARQVIDEAAFLELHRLLWDEAELEATVSLGPTAGSSESISQVAAPREGPLTIRRTGAARANRALREALKDKIDTAQLDDAVSQVAQGRAQLLTQPLVAAGALEAPALVELTRSMPNGVALCQQCGAGVEVPGATSMQVLGPLGEGGMGVVKLARDADLGRKVALKSLRQEIAGNQEVLDRFLHEAQVTAQLDHPGVVPVHGLRVGADGELSYSMKLVRGRTLDDVIKQAASAYQEGGRPDQAVGLEARLEIFLRVCDAVHFAHIKGVLHRDLKPENVMVGPFGEVYVVDWGLARLIGVPDDSDEAPVKLEELESFLGQIEGPAQHHTQEGQIMGTPAYMSPEQALGQHHTLDARSDQFALGMILYHLVCLKRAAQGGNAMATLTLIQQDMLNPVEHAYGDRIPRELAGIIGRSLQNDREARYGSVAELAEDVRRYLRHEEVIAAPDGPAHKAMRWMVRNRFATLLLVLGLVLLLAFLTIVDLASRRSAEMRAHRHQQRLGRFATSSGRQTERINARFLRVERRLEILAATARYALTLGTALDEQPFFDSEVGPPERTPDDMVKSAAYQREISVREPVFRLAPGVTPEAALPTAQRMLALRPLLRRALIAGVPGKYEAASPAAVDDALRQRQGPLAWVYIGLANGVHLGYPGKFGYAKGYDPRKRPWYSQASQRQNPVWGAPYVDASGLGVVIACAQAIRDAEGKLLGVAGVDMTLDYVVRNLLPLPGEKTRRTYLVSPDGKVLVRSGGEANQLSSEPLPFPEVREEIVAGRSGVVHLRDADPPRLIGYARLDTVGWYYVVEADAREILYLPGEGEGD